MKHRVGRHFFDLVDEDANPLVVALALQDNSSVGLQHYSREFAELHAELREMLRSRVEFSYQGFNESVGVYREVVNSLKIGHEEIHTSKQALTKLQEQVSERKPVLRDLQQKSMLYKQKLDILADLEFLQQIPQKYEACVARKQFNKARMLLGQSLETVTIRDLTNEPSIKPLLDYVQTQQSQLVGKVVDEIRAHVYLTSPFAQKRLVQGTSSIPLYSEESSNSIDDPDYVDFIESLPNLPEIESENNPESNSFAYLASLISTLSDLQSLDSSLEKMQRRLAHDLNSMVHSVTREVIKDLDLTPDILDIKSSSSTLLEQFRSIDQTALSTLARMLFLRFTRFLESQRAISEIAKHHGTSYDFDAACERTTAAVRSFVLSYLGTKSPNDNKFRNNKSGASTENSKNGGINGVSKRDKEPIFQFGPTDEDTKSLRDFDTLRDTIKRSVPGLLPDDPTQVFAETHKEEQLEVVAPAHILNIRPLLEPLTMFFGSARNIANTKASKDMFDSFLDKFLQQSFVPRLKEAFDDAIDEIADEEDAFTEMSNWRSKSQIPIVNCASQFSETLCLLSQLLDTGTTYREEYASIFVGLLQRIAEYFKIHLVTLFKATAAVSGGSSKRNASALSSSGHRGGSKGYRNALNNNSHLYQKLIKTWELAVHAPLFPLLEKRYEDKSPNTKEEFEIYFANRRQPNSNKLAFSLGDQMEVSAFKQITLLITSIQWMVLRLRKMRKVSDNGDVGTSSTHNISSRVRRRWTLLDTSNALSVGLNHGDNPATSLLNATAILAGNTLKQYDHIVSTLEMHSLYALCALRVDIFMSTVCHFDQMVSSRDFSNSNRGEERDPVVDRMQQSLSLASEIFDKHLLSTDRKFILGGIPQFMNDLFILEAVNITEINEAGQNQLLTNVFALQQMLTSIVEDPRQVDFSRASGFIEFMRLNPSLIIDKVRDGATSLSQSDIKLLLEIRHRHAGPGSHVSGNLATQLSQLQKIFNGEDITTSSSSTGSSATPSSTSSRGASNTAGPAPATNVSRTISKPNNTTAPTTSVAATPGPGVTAAASPRNVAERNRRRSSPTKNRTPIQPTRREEDPEVIRRRELAQEEANRRREEENKARAEELHREREALKAKSYEAERQRELERQRRADEEEKKRIIQEEKNRRQILEERRQKQLQQQQREEELRSQQEEAERIASMKAHQKREEESRARRAAEEEASAKRVAERQSRGIEQVRQQQQMEEAEIEKYSRELRELEEAQQRNLRRGSEQTTAASLQATPVNSAGNTTAAPAPTIKSVPSKSSLTAAAPSAGASRSPLLNHRPRFESSHTSTQQTNPPSQLAASQSNNSNNSLASSGSGSSSSSGLTVRKSRSNLREPLSVNTRGLRQDDLDMPHTPDQPTSIRPRTPSERALEAAQKVRVRQIPPPRRHG